MIKFRPEDFKVNRPSVQKIYREKGLKKTLEETSMSGIPLLATLTFVNELELDADEKKAVDDKIAELVEFYKVEIV